MSHLAGMAGAKEQFAMENKKSAGDAVVAGDLVPDYLKGTALPRCPAGGVYAIGNVGTDPTCSLAAAAPFPHFLP